MRPIVSHGVADTSIEYRSERSGGYDAQSQIRVHDAPRSVERKKMTSGHHETWVATMIVSGGS